MAILETKNLTYTYGVGTPFEKTAVENVNLSVEKGAFVGVIGHTGSGKSTLIQMLNGLIRPTSGQVLLNGEDIWAKPKEIRRVRFQVGMVFQYPEYQLFEETVIKDIMFGPKNMGLSDEEALKRAKEAAGVMKITAQDLKELQVVDDIIPEYGGADEDALTSIANYMKGNMKKFLKAQTGKSGEQLAAERYARFRKF